MSPGRGLCYSARAAIVLLCLSALLGCGSVGGVWTGANLLYNRHSLYKKFDDFQLRAQVARLLYHDSAFKRVLSGVDVSVFNGDLLIAGHVSTEVQRAALFTRLMAAPLSYRRLFRYVNVASMASNGVLDAWITTQIVSQSILDTEIDPHAFKVVTVDQVVYLMGDMMPPQALRLIDLARHTPNVRYVVKLLRYYHLTDRL